MRRVWKDVLFDPRHALLPSSASANYVRAVVALRVEGVSICAIARVEGIAWNTVARWLDKAGDAWRRLNRGRLVGFVVEELQADEIRSFAGSKKRPTPRPRFGRGAGHRR